MKKRLLVVLTSVCAAHLINAGEMPASAVSPGAGTVIDPGNTPNNERAPNLFDSNSGSKWLVFAPTGWVVYRFANNDQWALTNYLFQAANDANGRDPRVWQIEGSNDLAGNTVDDVLAATWRVVHEGSNTSDLGERFSWHSFACVENETAYNAYRLNILSNWGEAGATQLGEWKMAGNSGSAQMKALAPTNIGHGDATLNGRYDKFVSRDFEVYVVWGEQDLGCNLVAWQDSASATPIPEPDAGEPFDYTLTQLAPLTTYVARFYAVSGTAEAWSMPMRFTTFSAAPTIATLAAENIGGTSATLSANLSHAGGDATAAVVTLHWGETPEMANTIVFPAQAPGLVVTNLTGLNYGTTYYFRHSADNGVTGWSPEARQFRTRGEVVFGTPRSVSLPTSLKFSVTVEQAGVTPADITCWMGASEGALTQKVGEWPAVSGTPTLNCVVDNLTPGGVYWFAFCGENVMPVTLAPRAVWTAAKSVTVGNREVTWYNTQVWDTTTANWRYNGAATTFHQGDNASFPLTSSFSATLAENIDAANITVKNSNNSTWYLQGDKTLTLYGDMSLETNDRTSDNNYLLTKLSGDGSVTLKYGGFRLRNAANDFTGGVNIRNGRMRAELATDNAAYLGAGPLRLASDEIETDNALLSVSGNGSMGNSALVLAGGKNSGRIELTKATEGAVAYTLGGFSRAEGATLQVSATSLGNGETLTADGVQSLLNGDGILPPWIVSAATSGYMTYNAGGFGELAGYPASILTDTTTLAGNAAYSAARLNSSLDLGGHTLSLGGAILLNGVTLSNGTLDLANDNAYFYVPSGTATISAPLSGSAVFTKFGSGTLVFPAPQNRAYLAQEGVIEFNPSAPLTLSASLIGSGSFRVRNSAITLGNGEYDFNGLFLHSGGLNVGAGIHVNNHGEFTSGPLVQGYNDSPGSTLAITGGGRWTQARGKSFRVGTTLHASWLDAHDHAFLLAGADSTLDMNGGEFILGGVSNNSCHTWTNTVRITNGAVLTNAFFQLAHSQGGNYGSALVDGGARIHALGAGIGGGCAGNNGGGHFNTLTVSGAGTLWDNGNAIFSIGSTGGGNGATYNNVLVDQEALVRNVSTLGVGYKQGGSGAAVHDNTLVIANGGKVAIAFRNDWTSGFIVGAGHGAASSNNLLVVRDGGVLECGSAYADNCGLVNFGHQGVAERNVLRVETGGRIDNLPNLTIGRGHAAAGNNGRVEILNGGRVTMSADSFARVAVGQANPGQPNPAHTNGLHIAGANAVLDLNNAPLYIGYNTSIASDRLNAAANANWVRVSAGGTIANAGAITVGSATGNSVDNALILDGGDITAASLAVMPDNRLDVIVGASGLKPVVLTGNATLASGSVIQPFCADESKVWNYYPIIHSPNTIATNGVSLKPTQRNFIFKLALSEDQTILSLGTFPLGSLLIVR